MSQLRSCHDRHPCTGGGDLNLLGMDYQIFPRPGGPQIPSSFGIILVNDNVAQEFNETAQIRLRPAPGGEPDGAIGRLVLDVEVIDSNSKY